jgi:large subunit ribosomal protein L4
MSKVTVKVYGTDGKAKGEQELKGSVFGVKVKPEVVHEVVIGMQLSARHPYAHTKTRGDVSGGGKKPWKQKGTGRARHGSTRSPIWVGGGITFGPRSERDYEVKINRKLKKLAFLMSLSDKVADGKLLLVESLPVSEGKTKEVAGLVAKLPVSGKVGLVIAGKSEMASRATRNLPKVRLNNVADVSLLDVLKADYLVMTPDAAAKIEAAYGAKK